MGKKLILPLDKFRLVAYNFFGGEPPVDCNRRKAQVHHQCERTLEYILENSESIFYNQDKTSKFSLSAEDFCDIYTFSVTIENINAFAARAEKLSFLNMKSNSIAISYDDLLLYSEYFTSPLYFLHFLKQRKLATNSTNISLRDELDHLGMYIQYNMYSITADQFDDHSNIYWHGYRQELDNYFCRLYIPEMKISKPLQDIPLKMREIVDFLSAAKIDKRINLSTFLLDFSLEARNGFIETIDIILNRQNDIKSMVPAAMFGDVPYCLFIHSPNISTMTYQERSDYVYTLTVNKKDASFMWIELFYDGNQKIYNAVCKMCKYDDILDEDLARISLLNEGNIQNRIEIAKRMSPKNKLSRNSMCPCGSGKKYKICCLGK